MDHKIRFTLLTLLISIVTFAQEDFNDDTQDVPSAPIDNYLFFVCCCAIFLAYYYMVYKKRKSI